MLDHQAAETNDGFRQDRRLVVSLARLGAHTWEIQATDKAGNKADLKGSFTVANPPPPPAPPKVTSSNATQALGAWIRSRYGSGLRNYWTCPQQQIFSQQASCGAEFKTGASRHLVFAQVKPRSTAWMVSWG